MTKMGKWEDHESELLRQAVLLLGDKHWTEVSRWLAQNNIHRLPTQCRHRWHKTMMPNLKKGHWDEDENDLLRRAVQQQQADAFEGGALDWESVARQVPGKMGGALDWESVARQVPGRTGKACRERWISRLDPNINRAAFSEEEELKLMRLHQEYNNKWAKIAKHLPGRTADSVKSKYISIRRREQKDRNAKCYPSTEFLHPSTSLAGIMQSLADNQLDRKRKDFPMPALEHHQCSQSPPKRRLSPVSAPSSGTDHHFEHAKSTSSTASQLTDMVCEDHAEDSCVTDMVCDTLDSLRVHDLSRHSHSHSHSHQEANHTTRMKQSNSLDMDGDESWLNDVQSYSHISSMSPMAASVQVKEEAGGVAGSACADANAVAGPVEKQRSSSSSGSGGSSSSSSGSSGGGGGGGGFLNMLTAKLEHIEPLLLSDDFPSNPHLAPQQGLSSGYSSNNSSRSNSPSNHTDHTDHHQVPAVCAQRP